MITNRTKDWKLPASIFIGLVIGAFGAYIAIGNSMVTPFVLAWSALVGAYLLKYASDWKKDGQPVYLQMILIFTSIEIIAGALVGFASLLHLVNFTPSKLLLIVLVTALVGLSLYALLNRFANPETARLLDTDNGRFLILLVLFIIIVAVSYLVGVRIIEQM